MLDFFTFYFFTSEASVKGFEQIILVFRKAILVACVSEGGVVKLGGKGVT